MAGRHSAVEEDEIKQLRPILNTPAPIVYELIKQTISSSQKHEDDQQRHDKYQKSQ